MTALQKAGAYAALFQALAYVLGFAGMATLLNPGDTASLTGMQKMVFFLERKAWFEAWSFTIYIAFAPALVILAVALHERLKARAPELMKLATPFALIWAGLILASGMITILGTEAVAKFYTEDPAQALTIWRSLAVVSEALGGGVELVGGVWVLLVCAASRRGAQLPKALDYLGLGIGVAGVLSVIPTLKDLVALFGIGQIFWFAGLAVVMWRPMGTPALAAEAVG
ncbi:MAG: DUF4386 family protein [Gammaproteobacteria bacterium]|nr:DUF4386 family protein [Gammaproteobacteria bacterium]